MADVTWLPIPGLDHYEVSSDGQVRSLDRVVIKRNGQRYPIAGRPMKLFLRANGGYWRFTIKVQKKTFNYEVHRVVCEAFHGPPPTPKHQVRHLNGNSTDNRPENLCWGTASENAQDVLRHGTNHYASRTHCDQGHEFTPDNTHIVKGGSRKCRECVRQWRRNFVARQRAAGNWPPPHKPRRRPPRKRVPEPVIKNPTTEREWDLYLRQQRRPA